MEFDFYATRLHGKGGLQERLLGRTVDLKDSTQTVGLWFSFILKKHLLFIAGYLEAVRQWKDDVKEAKQFAMLLPCGFISEACKIIKQHHFMI